MLVRRGDSAALGRALCDLLDDPARRAELSARGAEVAAGYDWTVLARRILAVYETVMLARRARSPSEPTTTRVDGAPDGEPPRPFVPAAVGGRLA